jgi:hypothetical protein
MRVRLAINTEQTNVPPIHVPTKTYFAYLCAPHPRPLPRFTSQRLKKRSNHGCPAATGHRLLSQVHESAQPRLPRRRRTPLAGVWVCSTMASPSPPWFPWPCLGSGRRPPRMPCCIWPWPLPAPARPPLLPTISQRSGDSGSMYPGNHIRGCSINDASRSVRWKSSRGKQGCFGALLVMILPSQPIGNDSCDWIVLCLWLLWKLQ